MRKVIIAGGIIIALFLTILGCYKLFVIGGRILKISADPQSGFNYGYYVFLPYGLQKSEINYLLVEPNNTGKVSDDYSIHEKAAYDLIRFGTCHKIARQLKAALLVPVFDRPESNWTMYTHSLDRDTLQNNEGKLARIDLQLINMISNAKEKLQKEQYINLYDKILMSGFSASGSFVNRFVALHPDMLKAAATGGINCMPIIPAGEWEGKKLIYPIGVYDIKEIAGITFSTDDYKKVPQFIFMGSKDNNDTLPYDDAFGNDERQLIIDFLGKDMKKRWDVSVDIYKQLDIPAEMIMYDNVGHGINEKMLNDVIAFFEENIK